MGSWTTNQFAYKFSYGATGTVEYGLWNTGLDRIDSRLGAYFSVKDPAFNAVGDGLTDDNGAFQAALDAMPGVGQTNYGQPGQVGNVLLVPPGRYLVNGVKPKANTTIRGWGGR